MKLSWKNAREAILALLACMGLALGAPAGAQDFPAKPIRFIVPYPPGGSGDFVGRLYAEHLSKVIGQPVVVDNRPGAATNIAGELLSRAAPDGYTLMMGTSQSIINAVFGPAPPFDAVEGFAPVAMLAHLPFMVAANPGSSIVSARDLATAAGANRLTLAHAQFDAQVKLLSITMAQPIVAVPYKGGAQAVTDTVSGQVSTVLSLVPVLMSQVKAGKLRAVAIASEKRLEALPDVATFAEQGFPKFTTSFWMSVLAPQGTPEAIVRSLADASLRVVGEPGYGERLRYSGGEPVIAGPEGTASRMREEHRIWVSAASARP